MTISSLSTHIGDQHFFAMEIDHSRVWGLRALRILSLLLGLFVLGGCEANQHSMLGSPAIAAADASSASVKPEELRMWMTIGEYRFYVTLTDNETSQALAALLPLTLDMSEHNGNEKYASLPKALPTKASRPGTIRNGDLMLFGSQTLVVFYSAFNSSYSYTRIGRINDPAGLVQALGRKDVRVVFSKN